MAHLEINSSDGELNIHEDCYIMLMYRCIGMVVKDATEY